MFDERDRDQVARAKAAGREVLLECIACGGSITAEHGVGIEKLALMDRLFAPADLEAMRHVRQALDPLGLLNPGKVLPESRILMSSSRKQQPGFRVPLRLAQQCGGARWRAAVHRAAPQPSHRLT